jgi:hypothetical protein
MIRSHLRSFLFGPPLAATALAGLSGAPPSFRAESDEELKAGRSTRLCSCIGCLSVTKNALLTKAEFLRFTCLSLVPAERYTSRRRRYIPSAVPVIVQDRDATYTPAQSIRMTSAGSFPGWYPGRFERQHTAIAAPLAVSPALYGLTYKERLYEDVPALGADCSSTLCKSRRPPPESERFTARRG